MEAFVNQQSARMPTERRLEVDDEWVAVSLTRDKVIVSLRRECFCGGAAEQHRCDAPTLELKPV